MTDQLVAARAQLLITVAEAAKRLSLGRSLTYRFVQTGALPSIKIGGARRILVSDLEQFVLTLRDGVEEGE